MNRLFRLGAVLRARQAQEDAAKAEVVRVRRAAADAAELASRREAALQEAEVPAEGVAPSIAAALAARQALAADLSLARRLVAERSQAVHERMRDLTEKAQARRAVEKLIERQIAAERRLAALAEQRALDDIAATRRPSVTVGSEQVPGGVW
ncbi:MAG TPA: flagellar FliJ family protein [Micromonospora sp.]|jgi:flagellar FliJ protein|nr:MAG: cell envelope biogenesis protein TolA [Actinomycetota bacterium]